MRARDCCYLFQELGKRERRRRRGVRWILKETRNFKNEEEEDLCFVSLFVVLRGKIKNKKMVFCQIWPSKFAARSNSFSSVFKDGKNQFPRSVSFISVTIFIYSFCLLYYYSEGPQVYTRPINKLGPIKGHTL